MLLLDVVPVPVLAAVRSAEPAARAFAAHWCRRFLKWLHRASEAVQTAFHDTARVVRLLFDKLLQAAASHAASAWAIAEALAQDAAADADVCPVLFLSADTDALVLPVEDDAVSAATPAPALEDADGAQVVHVADVEATTLVDDAPNQRRAVVFTMANLEEYARRRELRRASRVVQYPRYIVGRRAALFAASLRVSAEHVKPPGPHFIARAYDAAELALTNDMAVSHDGCCGSIEREACVCAHLVAPLFAVFVARERLSVDSTRAGALLQVLKAVAWVDASAIVDEGDVFQADRTLRYLGFDLDVAIDCVLCGEDPCPVDFF